LTSSGWGNVSQKRHFLINNFPNEHTLFRNEFYGWLQRKEEKK